MYVGSTKIAEAYLGSTLVYTSSGPTPGNTVTIGGKVYPYATMPDGRDWIIYNLDYIPPSDITLSSSLQYRSSSRYYTATYFQYDETTYGWSGLKYGLLYNYNAATYLKVNSSTLFPGWHIPTLAEYQALSQAVGSDPQALQAPSWNNGTGLFNALPSGSGTVSSNGSVTWANDRACFFWSNSSTVTSSNENLMSIISFWGSYTLAVSTSSMTSTGTRNNNYNSIRLIKDV